MTTTTGPGHAGPGQASPEEAGAARAATELALAAKGSVGAAIINDAVRPHPSLLRTFAAMMARDGRVMWRKAIATFTRAVVQPLLFVFVFTYVMPKIHSGVFSAGARGGITFGTVLLPGLMASMLFMQGILAVTFPLVMEFSWQRTIEDRALAPVPIQLLAAEKIVMGAIQAIIGSLIVIPIVMLVHASGQSPQVNVSNWPLLVAVLIFGAVLASSLGLLLGTLMDPRTMQMLFAVILLPATMLGCVYYPWSDLQAIRWLQIAVLFNPMVYISEGLRSVLTPQIGHLELWAVLLMLIGGSVVLVYLSAKTFTRRVVT
jgi:ABC-type multidrug transport system permease subunit